MAKKKFWTPDRIVTILAISISLFTLIIFVKQTNIIERQSRLSVMPYLDVETGYNPQEDYVKVTLSNYGVGPAIIEEMRIHYEGESYEMDFASFLESDIFQIDSIAILESASIHRGLAIPAGTDRIAVKVGGSGERYIKAGKFLRKLQRNDFNFEIIYSSIYDDKWRLSLAEDIPKEL